jgi:uncharacterized membrane protein YoaT (DUF817 family)
MLARTQSRFHEVRILLENHVPRTAARRFLWEFFLFGFKEGWACLFGATLLALLLLTKWLWPAGIAFARYDFLFLSALAIQAMLLLFRMETVREAQIIFIFHVIGTVMELFKTNVGSWSYPEPSIFHIGPVPLFSGFMYASIGSYLARITRIFDLRYSRYPDRRLTVLLAGLIYVNFFTHHYLPDIRILLFLLTAIAFGPTWVHPAIPDMAPHAAVARLRPHRLLYLGRRKHRHLHDDLALPAPGQWLGIGARRQVWLVVLADDHQLHSRLVREPAASAGERDRAQRCADARSACRNTIAAVRSNTAPP